jgi:hypothetical protein
VGFLLAVDENQVWLDAAIRRQDYRAIPPSMRCLDSFGEIDFALILVSV